MRTGERDADVVCRYLRTFATRDLDELRTVVADNVEIYGAGQFVRGRHNVEAAVMTPGLSVVGQQCTCDQSGGSCPPSTRQERHIVHPVSGPTGITLQSNRILKIVDRCACYGVYSDPP
jgi:hypothetical protein